MSTMPDPGRAGQVTDPPEPRQRSPLALTDEEARNLRVALRTAMRKVGGIMHLSDRLGVARGTLYRAANVKRRPSPGLAIRVAALLDTTVETVLTGKPAAAPARRAA